MSDEIANVPPAVVEGQPATPETVVQPAETTDDPPPETVAGDTEAEAESDATDAEKSEARKRRERRERKTERLIAEKAALEERLRMLEERAKPAVPDPEPAKAPVASDYQTYEGYLQALARWEASQVTQDLRRSREDDARRAEADRVQQANAERMRAFAKERPDFQEAVEDLNDVPMPDAVLRAAERVITRHDDGPAILYYLGKNPEEAERLSRAHPDDVAFHLGQIAAKVRAPAPRIVSKAPSPIKPPASQAPASRDPDKMSMAEYVEWRKSKTPR